MTQRATGKLGLYSLLALLLTAATCPPTPSPVTITYEQVGACNRYQQTTGGAGNSVSAGANGAFVLFRIKTLDNSKSAAAFNFDPDRLFITGSSPQEHVDTSLALTHDLAPISAVAVTVPAGKNQGNDGIAVVRVSTSAVDGASEANNSNYFLAYDTPPGGPSVGLEKKNLNQSTFRQTNDCREIHF
jgi:hypothetical protein